MLSNWIYHVLSTLSHIRMKDNIFCYLFTVRVNGEYNHQQSYAHSPVICCFVFAVFFLFHDFAFGLPFGIIKKVDYYEFMKRHRWQKALCPRHQILWVACPDGNISWIHLKAEQHSNLHWHGASQFSHTAHMNKTSYWYAVIKLQWQVETAGLNAIRKTKNEKWSNRNLQDC